jgi:DNA-binding transcriptional LysR family regulator
LDRIDTIAAFVAVAESGSFVGAARRLGRSPAALTRAVAALERGLGTRLFTRTTRTVALTDAGRRHL